MIELLKVLLGPAIVACVYIWIYIHETKKD
jgi:hypothetical protein